MMIDFASLASKLLIVGGLMFVVLALVSAVREEFASKKGGAGAHQESIAGDVATLVEQVRKSPRWLAMVCVGIAVIVCGSALETGYLKSLLGQADLTEGVKAARK